MPDFLVGLFIHFFFPMGPSVQDIPAPGLNTAVHGALDYQLYLPAGWVDDKDTAWPVVLHLHGQMEDAATVEDVAGLALPRHAENAAQRGTVFPFIVISPRLPPGELCWRDRALEIDEILDDVIATYHGDETRVYCTGYSIGGWGAWRLAALWPDRFAAVAPLCGFWEYGDRVPGTWPEDELKPLVSVPLWTFHGERDAAVGVNETMAIVRGLERLNGSPLLTVFPEMDHDIWSTVYSEEFSLPGRDTEVTLYDWFLIHRRASGVVE